MGKWTSLAVEAEKSQKRATHELTELTKVGEGGVLSVLSVGGRPISVAGNASQAESVGPGNVANPANPSLEVPPVHPPLDKATQAELARLVRLFARSQGFTQEDTEEALQVALAHPDNALAFYRGEAARLKDPQVEARRTRVLEMLEEHPTARYAVLTDTTTDSEAVILTLAIRGEATCELRIPRDRYDPFLLLDLIERHGATVH